jgi:hypothetical protein
MLVKDKPENIPSTNELDKHHVDSGEREIRLGQNVLLVLDDPPKLGETRDIVLRMRCVRRAADQLNTDGDITHFCGMKIVTAWELGAPKPPDPNENQGSLLDVDGNVEDDPDSDND